MELFVRIVEFGLDKIIDISVDDIVDVLFSHVTFPTSLLNLSCTESFVFRMGKNPDLITGIFPCNGLVELELGDDKNGCAINGATKAPIPNAK